MTPKQRLPAVDRSLMTARIEPSNRLRCSLCGERAVFLTPAGVMCPDDAMRTAIRQAPDGEWLPVLIHQPDRASDRGHGRLPDRVTGPA